MCTLEKRGRVLILTLTGSGEHRLGPDMISSLRSALATARSDSTAGALVVTNEGRFFCNGFDLAWTGNSKAKLMTLVSQAKPLIADLVSLPMPTIAAVSGHVAAAGVMFALAHDYVYMRGDRGVFYCSELDVGLPFPPYFMVLMRSKLTKPGTLRDLALGAKKINAIEGKERGLVDKVFESASDVLPEAVKMAEQLAARNWIGGVYASIRMSMYPDLCRSVGLPQESDDEVEKHFVSRL
ncbi:Fatty acid oxidation complex subunit alpha [Rhynchospora pubera]|uniref:Delta(3)-Delta(2)-enoyl-CoA isomerase n=1 Tax=Rhynchospora pubera TaxID=906938 RepID=A0AAV8DU60_9POAL|nr:Fatty acid oxidation complex subunit alpha [Rhynchospora pubera]KAJ4780642.1 Fatty acid oxidation complex subunit alpha [Rhynchospora pubera]KAJ4806795.1 Fatty acid oxidation complex subunit alpha [Rhynchospora pubera]